LASFESIFPSDREGPSVGTLTIGKYLVEQTIHSIEEKLTFKMEFHEVRNTAPISVELVSEHQMKGTILLKDYPEQFLLEISFFMERSFYIEKKSTVNNIAISLVLTGIIFVFLTIFLLNRFIISRISNLSEQLYYIQQEGNLNSRFICTKHQHDEISKADTAMYEAKNRGKNQYIFFHEIINE